MSSVSGLSARHRATARSLIVAGCERMLANRGSVHYTQSSSRWEGIQKGLSIRKGQFPKHSDCSSSATWLLWSALHDEFGVRDVVNGLNWRGGYTGTILNHGKPVQHWSSIKVGDLLVYGAGTGQHVVVCLGGGVAFSHGSEAGPFKVALAYRGGPYRIRRFI